MPRIEAMPSMHASSCCRAAVASEWLSRLMSPASFDHTAGTTSGSLSPSFGPSCSCTAVPPSSSRRPLKFVSSAMRLICTSSALASICIAMRSPAL
jgi:hypothetical protein